MRFLFNKDYYMNCKEPSTKIRIVTINKNKHINYSLYCKEPSTKIRIVTLSNT